MPKKPVGAIINLDEQAAIPTGPLLAIWKSAREALWRETPGGAWAAIDCGALPPAAALAPIGHQRIGERWYTVCAVMAAG